MRMPQDFVDAINAAVLEVNPNAGHTTYVSATLGSDFDEWLGPEAIMKYGLAPLPADAVAAFNAKFEEKREELKAALVASAVEVERRRVAGELEDKPPRTGLPSRTMDEVMAELDVKKNASTLGQSSQPKGE